MTSPLTSGAQSNSFLQQFTNQADEEIASVTLIFEYPGIVHDNLK